MIRGAGEKTREATNPQAKRSGRPLPRSPALLLKFSCGPILEGARAGSREHTAIGPIPLGALRSVAPHVRIAGDSCAEGDAQV
jgi:hypothetical protein